MNKQQIIEHAERIIRQEAYQGRIQEELKNLGFDAHMMEYVISVMMGYSRSTITNTEVLHM